MRCTVQVPAKINLSLDVVGKREDGYHLLETVMQSIDLYDTVRVSVTDRESFESEPIRIFAQNPTFPCDSRNTCHKAASRFIEAFRTNSRPQAFFDNRQIRIHITKNIPQAAGLAGGSADAAAVLTALNHLCGRPFTDPVLSGIGAGVGADVPFCLKGGTVLCTGIGEILDPLPTLGGIPLIVVKPDFGVSTPWVFSRLDLSVLKVRPDTPGVVRSIGRKDMDGLFRKTANVLESVTLPAYPVLVRIKEALLAAGSCGALMSGSGPSVFAVFDTPEQARTAGETLRQNPGFARFRIIETTTAPNGPVVLPEET